MSEITDNPVGQAIAINRTSALSVPNGATVPYTGASVVLNTMTGATHNDAPGEMTFPATGLFRLSGLVDYGAFWGRVEFSVNGTAQLRAPYRCPPRSSVAYVPTPPIAMNTGENVRMMRSPLSANSLEVLGSTWFALERIR
jgi:hypothetical protein